MNDHNEAGIRVKLINRTIHRCGWNEDLIRREEKAGTVKIIGLKSLRRAL